MNGTIEINENALSENIEVKKVSEGVTTNVLPQKINAGEEIGTITVGGVTQKISAVEDLDLKAGSTLSVRLSKNSEAVLLMAMFHCTDKKIALKDNLADYINIKNGIRMNPVLLFRPKNYIISRSVPKSRPTYL